MAQRDLAEAIPSFNQDVLLLDAIGDGTADRRSAAAVAPETSCIITSGSTGKPKGRDLGPLANRRHGTAKGTRARPRTLQFAPLSFDVHFQEMFSTWATGGTLGLVAEGLRRDTRALWRYLGARAVDRIFVPFVALQSLAEVAAAEPLPPLREVITAGEQLHASPAIRSLFERLPQATLHNHYGPSETHVVTTVELSGDPASWPDLPPIGRPIDRARIYLLDDRMQPVPAGVPGQLYVGGSVLALGYLNRPELTAARFIDDPFARTGARLYATGDLAIPRRRGHQFSDARTCRSRSAGSASAGERKRARPALGRGAVCRQRVEDSPGRSGSSRRRARRRPACGPELQAFLERACPTMVPSTFMSLPALPLTPSGRWITRRCPSRTCSPGRRPAMRAPRDPVEEQLAAIYADVLRVEGVGVDDNFFDLGGPRCWRRGSSRIAMPSSGAAAPLHLQFPTVASRSRRRSSTRVGVAPRTRFHAVVRLACHCHAPAAPLVPEQLQPNVVYNVSRTFMFSARRARTRSRRHERIVRRHSAAHDLRLDRRRGRFS